MKTIELVCGGKPVQFTTRSVTIDGKEYFYSLMSGVSHNEIEHYYSFRYDGELISLPYDEKSIKVFQVIFKQVQTLEAQKIATQQLSVAAIAAAEAKEAEKKRLEAEAAKAKEAEAADEWVDAAETEAAEVPVDGETAPAEEAAAQAEGQATEEAAAQAEGQATEEAAAQAEGQAAEEAKAPAKEKKPVDPELHARKKKSITKFVIILIVFAALAVGYHFIFGESDTLSPNTPDSQTQEYDDIDQIIDDLQ